MMIHIGKYVLVLSLCAHAAFPISVLRMQLNNAKDDVSGTGAPATDGAIGHDGRSTNVSAPPQVSLISEIRRLDVTTLSEDGYQKVAALKDDAKMSSFVKLFLKAQNKYIPAEQEGKLAGFVPWFSGTKATQSLSAMQRELSTHSWVKDKQARRASSAAAHAAPTKTDLDNGLPRKEAVNETALAVVREMLSDAGLKLTENEYQKVAALQDDAAMSAFVKGMLARESSFIPQDEEGKLFGFVPYFSGTKATQSLEKMRNELYSKPWVKNVQAIFAPVEVTEDQYQEMAALHNDGAMSVFIKELLASENKFVPQEAEHEFAGFVQWFSGTKATQSLAKMREELSHKGWVRDMSAALQPGAEATETQYQDIAALRNDGAMMAFVRNVLTSEDKFVPPEGQSELAGFVQWYSGTKATQSLAKMREELFSKPWVLDAQASSIPENVAFAVASAPPRPSASGARGANEQVTEAQYQEMAALRDDAAMIQFVKMVLALENKFVPRESEAELENFVPRFSGTKGTQSLKRLRRELFAVSWVKNMKDAKPPSGGAASSASVSIPFNASASPLRTQVEAEPIPADDDASSQRVHDETPPLLADGNASLQREHVETHPATADANAEPRQVYEQAPIPAEAVANSQRVQAAASPTPAHAIAKPLRTKAEAPSLSSNMSAVSGLHTPYEGRADATCAECFVWGWSRILSFNTFRTRMAHSKKPNRKALFRDHSWKEDGMFDSKEGVYWLVLTSEVKVQAYFTANASHAEFTALQAIAVSGPVVGDNTLVINTLKKAVTWNDKKILHKMPSEFSNKFVQARYSQQSELVKLGEQGPGVEFAFSNGLFLVVNRWPSTLAVRIHMCENHVGHGRQTGQCGTLEHKPLTDSQKLTGPSAPRLNQEQVLFRSSEA